MLMGRPFTLSNNFKWSTKKTDPADEDDKKAHLNITASIHLRKIPKGAIFSVIRASTQVSCVEALNALNMAPLMTFTAPANLTGPLFEYTA